jgi:sporulation protein YlmC with PRC-barrel domain
MVRLLSGQPTTPATVKTDAKSKRAAKDAVPAIPPELLLRRDHNIRYERNGAVFATDGKVGSLKKVVVDENEGEVVELVVAIDGADRTVLLTPDLVDKSAGSAIFLTINRIQFVQRANSAPVYQKKQFEKANLKTLLKREDASAKSASRRTISNATPDYVETPSGSPLDRLNRKQDLIAAD